MPLPATSLYAALLAALFLVLSLRVVRVRYRYHVALGTPHRLVERAVRAHGNCAEYVPFGLVLLGLLEGMGLPLAACMRWAAPSSPAACCTPGASARSRRCCASAPPAWR